MRLFAIPRRGRAVWRFICVPSLVFAQVPSIAKLIVLYALSHIGKYAPHWIVNKEPPSL
jgi:hypothetical protein